MVMGTGLPNEIILQVLKFADFSDYQTVSALLQCFELRPLVESLVHTLIISSHSIDSQTLHQLRKTSDHRNRTHTNLHYFQIPKLYLDDTAKKYERSPLVMTEISNLLSHIMSRDSPSSCCEFIIVELYTHFEFFQRDLIILDQFPVAISIPFIVEINKSAEIDDRIIRPCFVLEESEEGSRHFNMCSECLSLISNDQSPSKNATSPNNYSLDPLGTLFMIDQWPSRSFEIERRLIRGNSNNSSSCENFRPDYKYVHLFRNGTAYYSNDLTTRFRSRYDKKYHLVNIELLEIFHCRKPLATYSKMIEVGPFNARAALTTSESDIDYGYKRYISRRKYDANDSKLSSILDDLVCNPILSQYDNIEMFKNLRSIEVILGKSEMPVEIQHDSTIVEDPLPIHRLQKHGVKYNFGQSDVLKLFLRGMLGHMSDTDGSPYSNWIENYLRHDDISAVRFRIFRPFEERRKPRDC